MDEVRDVRACVSGGSARRGGNVAHVACVHVHSVIVAHDTQKTTVHRPMFTQRTQRLKLAHTRTRIKRIQKRSGRMRMRTTTRSTYGRQMSSEYVAPNAQHRTTCAVEHWRTYARTIKLIRCCAGAQ